uniref:Uncharacterized protein n=1 Tax=viral metagenome TaxID=1070528 RepID=A0A6C0DRQ7_9ZZZZ
MASLEEVWGKPFPTKHYSMVSKPGMAQKEEPRDPEKEGRIAPTPQHRSATAVQRHRKTIDDLSKSLPIVQNDDEADSNYAPVRVGGTKEGFTATKTGYSKPFFPKDDGTSFAYAPSSFQDSAHDVKLDRILRMIEQNKTGYETPSSHDMALYVFTGVMTLFVLDTFVNLGRRMG